MAKINNVSFKVSDDELALIKQEIQGPDYNGNLSVYLRKIWEGREDMVIEIEPDYERQKGYYEREITKLETQIEKLQDRLSQANRSTGLAGVDTKQQNVHRLIAEAVAKTKEEIAQATLKEKYELLVKQHEDLITEFKRLEKENQEFSEGAKAEAKFGTYLDMGSKALGALIESSPSIKARYDQGGFAGLAGIGGGGNGLVLSSPEQEQDLKLGQVIRQAFAGEKYGQIIDVIRYMRDNNGVLGAIVQSPKFQAFMSAARAA